MSPADRWWWRPKAVVRSCYNVVVVSRTYTYNSIIYDWRCGNTLCGNTEQYWCRWTAHRGNKWLTNHGIRCRCFDKQYLHRSPCLRYNTECVERRLIHCVGIQNNIGAAGLHTVGINDWPTMAFGAVVSINNTYIARRVSGITRSVLNVVWYTMNVNTTLLIAVEIYRRWRNITEMCSIGNGFDHVVSVYCGIDSDIGDTSRAKKIWRWSPPIFIRRLAQWFHLFNIYRWVNAS